MNDNTETEPLTPRQRVEYGSLGDRFTALPETFLYVARVSGTVTPVKIGRSINVATRLRGMQTPAPMELLVSVPEWAVSEAQAHTRFAGQRSHGEWFHFSDEMAQWIADLPAVHAAIAPLARRVRSALRLNLDGYVHPLISTLDTLARAERRTAKKIEERERERLKRLAEKEKEREREAQRLERERIRAAGCGLCGKAPSPVYNTMFPDLRACSSCGVWLREYAHALDAAQLKAETCAAKLRRQADAIERLAALRISNTTAHKHRAKSVEMVDLPIIVEVP